MIVLSFAGFIITGFLSFGMGVFVTLAVQKKRRQQKTQQG